MAIQTGDLVKVVKGCKARDVSIRSSWLVETITTFEGSPRLLLRQMNTPGVRRLAWYARHVNRLSDPVVNLNDGNPFHKIQVRKVL